MTGQLSVGLDHSEYLKKLCYNFTMNLDKPTMLPKDLLLRAYAKKDGDVWVACCLDLSLAVQGDSLPDVRQKLHEQITTYLRDALDGQDSAHAAYLLNRRAPWTEWVKYYGIRTLSPLLHIPRGLAAFCLPLPLKLA